MRSVCKWMIVASVFLLSTSQAVAQRRPPGGQGNPLMLLGQASVQKELKLTEAQIEKAQKMLESRMGLREELSNLTAEEREKKVKEMAAENERFTAELLKPEQAKRLKQIMLQQQGLTALSTPEVVKALKLTEAQQEKIKSLEKESQAQKLALRQPGAGGGEESMKKGRELDAGLLESVVKTFSAEQQAAWKELIGAPFKAELSRPRPPGGGRPPGQSS